MNGVRSSLPIALLLTACASPPSTWTEPTFGIRFALIPAGAFEMGSPEGEAGREPQERLHRVELSRPFYLGVTEVTQGEWFAVLGSRPSRFAACGDRCPVESVSWNEIQDFLRSLRGRTGRAFRLPTEAEWEFACRAGSAEAYATGRAIARADANFDAEDEAVSGSPMPVGSFPPNAFGLFDLHGNVWEWTADEHCPYPDGTVRDPVAACGSPLKVIRGGSWHFGPDSARCALRYTHRPEDSGFSLGFRLALTAEGPAGARVERP